MIKKLITWFIGLFMKSKSNKQVNKEIKQRKNKIKDLDKELKKEYTDVDEAMEEWRK